MNELVPQGRGEPTQRAKRVRMEIDDEFTSRASRVSELRKLNVAEEANRRVEGPASELLWEVDLLQPAHCAVDQRAFRIRELTWSLRLVSDISELLPLGLLLPPF